MRKAVYILSLLLIIATCFCACHPWAPYVYAGNDADLYSEAINSILGASGRMPDRQGYSDPFLEVVDQDEYGRRMFVYYDGCIMGRYSLFLLVSQKREKEVVHYYPDFNFIIGEELQELPDEALSHEKVSDEQKSWWRAYFSDSSIDELKQTNDWGKEIKIDNCIKQKIVQKKEDPLTYKEEDELYKEVFGEHNNNGSAHVKYLTKDDEGKLLYFIRHKSDSVHDYRMLIVDGDAHYCQKITDPTAYQEELAEFKREHNWKKS